ncbi:GxxExxY protein [Geomonas anaerohicana]|uniref:GxxExxY protein n=1 Tax=Geomonas anaerohicana TaxID=2798583 RepID=A0ABS0YBP9_9BACT|nr:GxxExxY protein [Geomonas anaerohicana]MBJ6749706.1 GxxExxY protein [Geomonas anaerohicana]
MIYEDVTGKILAACFDVSNELGNGFLESVYEKSLLIALEEAGLRAQRQVPLQVFYRNKNVGDFYADIVVEGMVLLELKAVKALAPEHVAQILNYLKATGIGIGLLINFGSPKSEYRRLGNRLCS